MFLGVYLFEVYSPRVTEVDSQAVGGDRLRTSEGRMSFVMKTKFPNGTKVQRQFPVLVVLAGLTECGFDVLTFTPRSLWLDGCIGEAAQFDTLSICHLAENVSG